MQGPVRGARPGRLVLLAIVIACLAGPAPALAAAITVTDFSLTVASPEAGGSVNASSSTSLSYGNATEDVKRTVGHFAPGLLANPEAVPHCPQALYLSDSCPADTLIGSSEADIQLLPPLGPTLTETGRIYNQELLAGEAGRLGIIVDTTPSKTFLTAPFYVRTDGDYGLDGVLDDLPRNIAGIGDIQIKRLSFTLFGVVNGRKFTRGPTSCALHTSTGDAVGYDDQTVVAGPASSFTPTACDRLPFKPTFQMSVGSRGSTGFNGHPPLRVTVTQQPGEAGVLSNGVTLPADLTPNLAAFQTMCSEAQLAAGGCPPASRVGGASATSPFLATPLSGPVWLVKKAGTVLPALVADLRGRVPIKISIASAIIGGRQVSTTVNGVPDLPVGSFSLGLDGGRNGVLLNKTNLCFEDGSSSRFRNLTAAVTFGAHSGATISSSPQLEVVGCEPGLAVSVRGARGSRPRLSATVTRHPGSEKIRTIELVLPRELRLVGAMLRGGFSANASGPLPRSAASRRGSRTLRVAKLPPDGAPSVVVGLRRGAVRATKALRHALRRHHARRLRFKVVSTDVNGTRYTSRASVRLKG